MVKVAHFADSENPKIAKKNFGHGFLVSAKPKVIFFILRLKFFCVSVLVSYYETDAPKPENEKDKTIVVDECLIGKVDLFFNSHAVGINAA